jgi:hypothetical protein
MFIGFECLVDILPECGEILEFLVSGAPTPWSGKFGVGMEIPLIAYQPNPVADFLYLV